MGGDGRREKRGERSQEASEDDGEKIAGEKEVAGEGIEDKRRMI